MKDVKCACAAIVLGLLLAACGTTSPAAPTPPSSPAGMSAPASAYLTQILDYMQANSINRKTIDWPSFRQTVIAAAGTAQSISDLTPAIRTALGLLGDHHSYFRWPDGSYITNPTGLACGNDPVAPSPSLPPDVGYVKVRSFTGTADEGQRFAVVLQDVIRTADSRTPIGWIVDLRGNGGGDMWPMIAGVGPVLGEGTAGFFVDPDGQAKEWGYRDGASVQAGYRATVVPNPYTLERSNPRVAVLTDDRVASSGEATTIAFRGRPNTRSFGTATCGLSTANRPLSMSDGSVLWLTVSVMTDRTGTRYGAAVTPDEVISNPTAAVDRAIEWLRGAM